MKIFRANHILAMQIGMSFRVRIPPYDKVSLFDDTCRHKKKGEMTFKKFSEYRILKAPDDVFGNMSARH